jgi:hypothetical protein
MASLGSFTGHRRAQPPQNVVVLVRLDGDGRIVVKGTRLGLVLRGHRFVLMPLGVGERAGNPKYESVEVQDSECSSVCRRGFLTP